MRIMLDKENNPNTRMDSIKVSSRKQNSRPSERRKSSTFRGLSLKPLFGVESSNAKEGDDAQETTSLLKRFSSKRTSRKRVIKSTKDDNVTEKFEQQNIEEVMDSNTAAKVKDAGHTPKSQKLQKVNKDKSVDLPCNWDNSSDEENQRRRIPEKANSLRASAGRKLKRSMSLICGASRSKSVLAKSGLSSAPVSRAERRRQSLGSSLAHYINKKPALPPKDSKPMDCEADSSDNDHNSSLLQTSVCCTQPPVCSARKKIAAASRRLSESGVILSAKKLRLKRKSYERMNYERDCLSPALKSSTSNKDATITEEPAKPAKRSRSLKRTVSAGKVTNKSCNNEALPVNSAVMRNTAAKPVSRKDSVLKSARRKSMGIPGTPADQKTSGVYANVSTPTFMTCGYVMTDSPPDNYSSTDLPWVTMKRKRRSELANSTKVNSHNAGHTPLPPRKKRCSHAERLIE